MQMESIHFEEEFHSFSHQQHESATLSGSAYAGTNLMSQENVSKGFIFYSHDSLALILATILARSLSLSLSGTEWRSLLPSLLLHHLLLLLLRRRLVSSWFLVFSLPFFSRRSGDKVEPAMMEPDVAPCTVDHL